MSFYFHKKLVSTLYFLWKDSLDCTEYTLVLREWTSWRSWVFSSLNTVHLSIYLGFVSVCLCLSEKILTRGNVHLKDGVLPGWPWILSLPQVLGLYTFSTTPSEKRWFLKKKLFSHSSRGWESKIMASQLTCCLAHSSEVMLSWDVVPPRGQKAYWSVSPTKDWFHPRAQIPQLSVIFQKSQPLTTVTFFEA